MRRREPRAGGSQERTRRPGNTAPRLRRVGLVRDRSGAARRVPRRHVTAVCNGKNVELVRSLGADEVIDYEREDFTQNGQTYDVVLDAVGKHSLFRSRRSLVPGGLYVATDRLYNFPLAFLTRWIGKKKVVFDVSGYERENVLLVKDLLEAGRYRAVIDRTYPLEDVVEATRYVESWQKTGNVVLTLNGVVR